METKLSTQLAHFVCDNLNTLTAKEANLLARAAVILAGKETAPSKPPLRSFLLLETDDEGSPWRAACNAVFESEEEAKDYVRHNEMFDILLVEMKGFI